MGNKWANKLSKNGGKFSKQQSNPFSWSLVALSFLRDGLWKSIFVSAYYHALGWLAEDFVDMHIKPERYKSAGTWKVMNMQKSNANARGMNEVFLCKLEWLPCSAGWDSPVQGHEYWVSQDAGKEAKLPHNSLVLSIGSSLKIRGVCLSHRTRIKE